MLTFMNKNNYYLEVGENGKKLLLLSNSTN